MPAEADSAVVRVPRLWESHGVLGLLPTPESFLGPRSSVFWALRLRPHLHRPVVVHFGSTCVWLQMLGTVCSLYPATQTCTPGCSSGAISAQDSLIHLFPWLQDFTMSPVWMI